MVRSIIPVLKILGIREHIAVRVGPPQAKESDSVLCHVDPRSRVLTQAAQLSFPRGNATAQRISSMIAGRLTTLSTIVLSGGRSVARSLKRSHAVGYAASQQRKLTTWFRALKVA